MSRSKWKGFFISSKLLNLKNTDNIIFNRNSFISNFFLNKLVKIYNGKAFKIFNITRDQIGFKFGEFSFTRKIYEKKKKKKY